MTVSLWVCYSVWQSGRGAPWRSEERNWPPLAYIESPAPAAARGLLIRQYEAVFTNLWRRPQSDADMCYYWADVQNCKIEKTARRTSMTGRMWRILGVLNVASWRRQAHRCMHFYPFLIISNTGHLRQIAYLRTSCATLFSLSFGKFWIF